MGQALAASSRAAAAVWKTADDALGEAISNLAFTGPEDALNLTVNSQPAILA
jgi:[acyl-carrier-protein] S-malonyltransferase